MNLLMKKLNIYEQIETIRTQGRTDTAYIPKGILTLTVSCAFLHFNNRLWFKGHLMLSSLSNIGDQTFNVDKARHYF